MRLLFVVQRYGPQIAGGAEQLTRQYATRLAGRGHDVDVVTSCAISYADWADVLPAGTTTDDGVTVHRLGVRHPRPNDRFGPLHDRATGPRSGAGRRSPVLADCWARMIGPELVDLDPWLRDRAAGYDAVVFSGYLYTPSTSGLPAVAAAVPTILQSVAHDEVPLRLTVMRRLFDHAAAINFLTPEEERLVVQRFRPPGLRRVIGAGVDTAPPDLPDDVRTRFGIGDDPYVVCVGRIDPAKGMHELAGFFEEHRRRHPGALKLVFIGSEVHPLRRHDDLVVTGFVDEATKWALLRGAAVLAQPSYFESFSLSLAEGWRCGLPAIVQGGNDVLAGQVARSGGGLSYRSFAEFDAALDLLRGSDGLRRNLGEAGRDYVDRYNWPTVLASFEQLVDDTIVAWNLGRRP